MIDDLSPSEPATDTTTALEAVAALPPMRPAPLLVPGSGGDGGDTFDADAIARAATGPTIHRDGSVSVSPQHSEPTPGELAVTDGLERRQLRGVAPIPEIPGVPGLAIPAPLADALVAYDDAVRDWEDAGERVSDLREEHARAKRARADHVRAAAAAINAGKPAPKLPKVQSEAEFRDAEEIGLALMDLKAGAVGRAASKTRDAFAQAAPEFIEPAAAHLTTSAREALDAIAEGRHKLNVALAAYEEVIRVRTISALGPNALHASKSRYGDVAYAIGQAMKSHRGNKFGGPDADQLLAQAASEAGWLGGVDPMSTDGPVEHIGGSGITRVPGNLTYQAARRLHRAQGSHFE